MKISKRGCKGFDGDLKVINSHGMIARYAVNLNINANKFFNKVNNKVRKAAKVLSFNSYAPALAAA